MIFLRSKITIALLLTAFAFGFASTAKAQTIAPASELVGVSDIPASNLTASLMPYPIADRDDLIALYSGSKYLDLYCAFNNCRFKCRRSQKRRCGAKQKACHTKTGNATLRGQAYGTGIGATIGGGIGTAIGGPVGGGIGAMAGGIIGGAAGGHMAKTQHRKGCRHQRTACRVDYSWYSGCVAKCNAASASRRSSSSRFQRRWRSARSGRKP